MKKCREIFKFFEEINKVIKSTSDIAFGPSN